jgi:hypothetical protein
MVLLDLESSVAESSFEILFDFVLGTDEVLEAGFSMSDGHRLVEAFQSLLIGFQNNKIIQV